jgi:hypothetical protein
MKVSVEDRNSFCGWIPVPVIIEYRLAARGLCVQIFVHVMYHDGINLKEQEPSS